MVNDWLSDLVARIKNGYSSGATEVVGPKTNMTLAVSQVLAKEGYVQSVNEDKGNIVIKLKYQGKKPGILGIRRISKPGVRIYSSIDKLPKVWGGLGISILTTPKGVISSKEAKKLNVGGEVIAQVW